jgi:hypothetical protein
MSSIASKTKTVQSTSSEETKAKQNPTENQWEELHIVNETTNGEQSESRQSGAEHPEEERASAEQDFCKTGPSERTNKYKYETFKGYAGERYLQEIIKDILPRALARTWAVAVSYQAPGKACYVGASRIAQRERLGERTIQKNFREMRRRGLYKTYASWTREKRADGSWSQRAIIAKDFERLYDLAYEYHLWVHAEGYIPADWEYADIIRGNKELYDKLIRFDNYRRILCCEKPGPKEQLTELEEHYQWYDQEHYQEDFGPEEGNASKYLPKQPIKRPPYRESKNPLGFTTYESSTSKEFLEEEVLDALEPEAIRNVEQERETKKETREQDTVTWERKEPKQERRAQRVEPSNPIETPQKEEMSREAAKDAEEFSVESIKDNPIAMAMFAKAAYEEQERKKEAQKHRHERRKEQKKRTRRTTPDLLTRATLQIIQYLGGDPKRQQSDLTRMSKLYWTATQIFANFTNSAFLDLLFEARDKTAKHRDVGNRVPYFFTCLENKLALSCQQMAYLRSPEPLYLDGHLQSFLHQMQLRYDRSGSHLDYDQWIQENYRC